MTNFETLLSQSMQNFKEGTIVKGRIIERRPREVMVDIGYKSEGAIDLGEFSPADDLAIGQEIEVLLERLEDEDGQVVLSRQKAAHKQNWDKIVKLSESGKTVQGIVRDIVKGGLMLDVGVEAFLPSSQIDINPPKNLREFLGKTLECRIVKLIEEERTEKRAKLLSHLDKGAKVKGRVKNLTEFGAFVDLDGLDGLLHVTDMTWGRLGHPSELLQTNQEIEVIVLEIDKERLRVSLGLKQMSENPWDKIAEKYPVNLKIRGKVTSLVPYGAFVQLEPGVEGLVHVSELSWTRRIARPSDVIQDGQEIEAIVISVSKEEQKLSLSVRHLEPNPWEEIHLRYPVGRPVKGVVRNTTAYGAFVELEEGIDGMIHVSDMSWTRKPTHASEVVKKGDTVDAQVLGIDKANQRISLGLKQLAEDPWKLVESRFKIGQMVKGTVSKVASFGAFIQLEGDLDGLVHISQISEERIAKVKDVLKPGQEIEARVIRLNKAERRIGLSIKAAAYSDEAFEKERNVLEDNSKSSDFLGGMEAAFDKAEEEYRPGESQPKS